MTNEPKKRKPRWKRPPSRPRLSLLRVRHSIPASQLATGPDGYLSPDPSAIYVHLGVVRQKPALCVVMRFDTGALGVHSSNLFELVPKEEVP